MNLNKTFSLLALLFYLTSCTTHSWRADLPKASVKLSEKDADGLFRQLQSQFSEISSLKTLVRARVEQGEERIKFRGTVLLRKPNEIRLETLAPMAAYALNVITVSKQQALSLDIPRKHAVLGPASPEALRRAIGLSLRPSDLILLFAPDLKGLSERCLEPAIECVVFGDATSGNYVIFDTKVAAVFWLDGQFEVSKIELLNAFDESTKFVASYSGYRKQSSLSFPSRINIEVPLADAKASLSVGTVKINDPIDDKLFALRVPPDFSLSRFD